MTANSAAPARSGDGTAAQQYGAAASGSAIFDLSAWTELELTGTDRAKFLHNFCTNDIKGLAVGRACQAFVTSVQGKLIAHLFVYAGESALRLVAAPGLAEKLIKHLSRYQINEDVSFHDVTGERRRILLVGPKATDLMGGIGFPVETFADGEHQSFARGESAVRISKNDLHLYYPSYLVAGPVGEIDELEAALVRSGALRAGSGVFEFLRISAGFPLYGVDITDANLAQEANLTKQAISFQKGCYLGQEPIARIDALGHVNQQLCVLQLDSVPVPVAGADVVAYGDDTQKIGRITSVAANPAGGATVALALMKRNHDKVGLPLQVAVVDELMQVVQGQIIGS